AAAAHRRTGRESAPTRPAEPAPEAWTAASATERSPAGARRGLRSWWGTDDRDRLPRTCGAGPAGDPRPHSRGGERGSWWEATPPVGSTRVRGRSATGGTAAPAHPPTRTLARRTSRADRTAPVPISGSAGS